MTWAKMDDRYDDNPKVRRAWRLSGVAVALHVHAITYSARHQTDGLVPIDWIEERFDIAKLKPREREKALATLVECKLFDVVDDTHYAVHDFLDYNPSKELVEREREWDRRRKELFRDPDLVEAIRARDGDRCRYCGTLVNWKDRRGRTGGTYDHVTPRGPNSLDNVVVACRYCNMAKGGRTPKEASMPLLAPGLDSSQNGSSSEAERSQVVSRHRPSHPSRPVPARPVRGED